MEQYFSDIKVWAKNLTLLCPMRDALPECPFNGLRRLPLAERVAAVDRMPGEQLEAIITHHSSCLHSRER